MEVQLTIEMIHDSAFYKTRPKSIQKLIDKLPGTHEYEIIDTGHICVIYSYSENGTVTVIRPVTEADEHFNLESHIEFINVFGLKPEDLKIRLDKPVMVDSSDITDEEVRVVKIQRSLAGSSDEDMMLVYDETREFTYEGPLTGDVARLMEDDVKIYAEAALIPNLDKDGNADGTFRFSVVHIIEDQEW